MKKWISLSVAALLFPVTLLAQTKETGLNRTDSLPETTTYLYMDSLFQQLPEVMVKGERPIAKIKEGKLIYDLSCLIKQQPADNAFEALTKLPGVQDNDDVLSIAGRSLTILINGKVSTLTYEQLLSRLKSIPSSQVVSAEVMLSAPARYQVRGAVINLITKNNIGQNKLTGELQTSWKQAHSGTFDQQVNLIYSREKLSLDIMYKYNYGSSYQATDKESYHSLNGEVHHLEIGGDSHNAGPSHEYRTGFDYAFSKKHRLSLVYNGSWSANHVLNSMWGSEESASRSHMNKYMHNAKLDYEIPFGLKLGAEYTYFDNPESQTLAGSINGTGRNVNSVSGQRINKWQLYAGQEHSLKSGWGVNYGTKLNLTSNNSYQRSTDGQGDVIPESTSDSHIDERVLNCYVGATKSFGDRFSFDASLALENYHTDLWNDWNLFPALNATWQVADGHLLQLSFSSDRTYPSYWSTMGSIFYSGAYTEIHGNPDLKPATDYTASLTYTLKSRYNFTLLYEENKDVFLQLPYLSKDRLAVIMKETNMNYRRNLGLQASAQYKARKWMNGNAFIYTFYNRDKSDSFFDLPFDRHKIVFICGTTTTFKLSSKPDLRFTLNGFYQHNAIQGIYDIDPVFRLNTTLRWTSPSQRASFTLSLRNINNSSMYAKVNYGGQRYGMKMLGDRRIFTATFIYRLGDYKEKKHEEVDTSRMGH